MTAISFKTGDLATSDLDAALDLQTRAFGPMPDSYGDTWRQRRTAAIEAGRMVGVFDGGRLVAHAMLRPFRQFWGGRDLPMSGVAGVAVAPDYRGRGVGSMLMRAVVERGVELGDAVSALYPATVPLYRRLGWEFAGAQHRVSVDADTLRRAGPVTVPVERVGVDDIDGVLAHVRRHWAALGASGPKALEAEPTKDLLASPNTFSYRTDDGLAIYGWEDGDLVVRHLTARSEASLRALWSIVGSGSSVAKTVYAYVEPHDPMHLLLPEAVRPSTRQERWMLRLLDAPAAIAGRGFPASVRFEIPLTVSDPLAAGCDGSWVLRVDGGAGSLVRTTEASDSLRLGPNGLAAMYAGTPLATLRAAGLVEGGRPDDDAVLDTAFAATPYLLEYF